MTTLFVADIHLNELEPLSAAIFLNFLYEQASHADALYILGDLFEFWVGDDYKTDFHEMIIQALQETSRHTPIYLMPGNRDFLIGKRFAKNSGCQLLKKDPYVTPIYGMPVLLTHGDVLCQQDKMYQMYRKCVHNGLLRQLFLQCPLKKRLALAQYFRKLSHSKMNQALIQKKLMSVLEISPRTVEKYVSQYKVNYIIHGHTHLPDQHSTTIKGKTITRIVLGPWHHYGFVLSCQPNRLKTGLDFKQWTIL